MNKKKSQNQFTKEEKDNVELSEIAVLKQELALLKTEHALLKEKFNIWNELAEEGLFFHENTSSSLEHIHHRVNILKSTANLLCRKEYCLR